MKHYFLIILFIWITSWTTNVYPSGIIPLSLDNRIDNDVKFVQLLHNVGFYSNDDFIHLRPILKNDDWYEERGTLIFPYIPNVQNHYRVTIDDLFSYLKSKDRKFFRLEKSTSTNPTKKFSTIPRISVNSNITMSFELNDSCVNMGNIYNFKLNPEEYHKIIDSINNIEYIYLAHTSPPNEKSISKGTISMTINGQYVMEYEGFRGNYSSFLTDFRFKTGTQPFSNFFEIVYKIAGTHISNIKEADFYQGYVIPIP